MGFFSRFNPKPGIEDFVSEFSRPNPYRWRILAVSVAITFTLFSVFTYEGVKGPPVQPEVDYITSWASDRTEEEIIASNIENQRIKDERAAMLEESAQRRKEMYRALGRASGMDVDAIEERIERERSERLQSSGASERSAGDTVAPAQ